MIEAGRSVPAPVKGPLADLGLRLASGLVLVALAIGTARAGGEIFVVTWLAAAIAVAWEWQRMIAAPQARTRVWVAALALVAAAVLARGNLPAVVAVVGLAAGIAAVLAGPQRRLWAAAGVVYAGLLLVATIGLRFSFPFGSRSIIWLFATVWSTDTFAYFGGRLIGGPKLWPRVSPSKTWSGTCVGTLAGAGIGTFAAVRDLPAPTAIVPILAVSLAASLFSQAGDAFESAMKRRFAIKDSSGLIPGHGGVMDRLDGFIFAAVFAFLFGSIRDLPSVAGGLFYWP